MAGNACFKALQLAPPRRRRQRFGDLDAFVAEAVALIHEEFAALTGLSVLCLPLAPSERWDHAAECPTSKHPPGADYAPPERRAECWQKHLKRFRQSATPHWHRRESGELCGVVPLRVRERCLATGMLVCPGTVDEQTFQRHMSVLVIVIENVLWRHADALASLSGQSYPKDRPSSASLTGPPLIPESLHHQVQRALTHIDNNLSDQRTTVANIARQLGTNSTYLGHLFATQIGLPMHSYIAQRRIELAKLLLTETDWQIKRVACGSGHGNADWFSHLFRVATGMTPTAYRQKAQRR
ncbi:MAG: AraC family transcriptional regulator [Planctomycetes bacterium]|nr:AraC family transcriptional regulator [Planctomycetota bacterium]